MKLTPKQEKFCQNYVSGMSGIESYKNAYDTNAKDSTIHAEVHKLLLRDDIQERIETIRKPLVKRVQLDVLSERDKKKKLIQERIEACILKDDDTAIARYIDILNKMDAEYININKNIESQEASITQLPIEALEKLARTS